MEDLSPGVEGFLSLGKYLKTSIERSRFEIMVDVEVMNLKCYKEMLTPKRIFFMPKKKYEIVSKEGYY